MPKSIHEIIEQADELADRFEDFDLEAAADVPVEEYLLRRAARARAESERDLAAAVVAARKASVSWRTIGAAVGTSAQAAHERYRALVDG